MHIYTHKYMCIYTHLSCGFVLVFSKIIILLQNHNLTDTHSKACDLTGKQGLNFLHL